jgi:hypothetical protein
MGLEELNVEVTSALLDHRNGLEALGLGSLLWSTDRLRMWPGSFGIVRSSSECRFTLLSQKWSVEDVKELFTVHHVAWACEGLKRLEMHGLWVGRAEFKADDDEEDEYDIQPGR